MRAEIVLSHDTSNVGKRKHDELKTFRLQKKKFYNAERCRRGTCIYNAEISAAYIYTFVS